MNYIYIDEFILDEKYWKYEIGTGYYSRHDHLNSSFETYNTCANCSGDIDLIFATSSQIYIQDNSYVSYF